MKILRGKMIPLFLVNILKFARCIYEGGLSQFLKIFALKTP